MTTAQSSLRAGPAASVPASLEINNVAGTTGPPARPRPPSHAPCIRLPIWDRERFIIHLNVADFAAAVESRLDPRLRGRPLIIAPQGGLRTVVLDMSEAAFQAGVRKGMRLDEARRRCPDAHALPPHTERYEQAMAALLQKALAYSPLIEPGERDGHLFVDVSRTSRIFGPPMDVAWRLRRQIREDLGLDPIWALASNKLTAKAASRTVKPTGEVIVTDGDETAFLAPLPVNWVPGLEAPDLACLAQFNLTHVGQVATLSPEQLEVLFGRRAGFVFEAVRGIDFTPIFPAGARPPQIRRHHVFGQDTNDRRSLERVLYILSEQAGARLRRRRLVARRLGLVVDYADGVRHIRQKALHPPTALDPMLFDTARAVLALAWTRRVRIRHLALVCDRLSFPPAQMALFADPDAPGEKRERLIPTLDRIRERFGTDAIRLGRIVAA